MLLSMIVRVGDSVSKLSRCRSPHLLLTTASLVGYLVVIVLFSSWQQKTLASGAEGKVSTGTGCLVVFGTGTVLRYCTGVKYVCTI